MLQYINEIVEKKNIIGKKITKIPRYSTKILTRWNDLFFEFQSRKLKPDIIHYTYYDKIYNFNNIKKILTVYDLIHEKFYNFRNMKKKSINLCDKIICISKNTQNELLNYYNLDIEKTSVVYLANHFSSEKNYVKDKIQIHICYMLEKINIKILKIL